jgi:pyruvate/2-oxoglutarate/acetoin dehydrogenase E1 component
VSLAQTINKISQAHLDNGGLIVGQNLAENHNLAGTIPFSDHPGICILPTTEAAGAGFSVGMALSGRPTIHILRFASFLWLQAAPLVCFAAQAKSVWGYDVPLFVRVSSDDGLGPTHSGMYHSPFAHMPGLKVVAPMTSGEYLEAWQWFQENRQPVIVSEHRASYTNELELPPIANDPHPEATIIMIGPARLQASETLAILTSKGIAAEVRHIWDFSDTLLVKHEKTVLIVDTTYERCSIAEHLALKLYQFSNKDLQCEVLGMFDRHPGVSRDRNGTPQPELIAEVLWHMLR